MNGNQGALIRSRLGQAIPSLSVDKDELLRISQLLRDRARAASEIEIQQFQFADQTGEQREKLCADIRACAELRITISGEMGEELYGVIEEVFGSPNFPEKVKSFFVNSEHIYKDIHNYSPRNSFSLKLDFSKPRILNFELMPSRKTPNNSSFTVNGSDVTWANGVFNELSNLIRQKSSKFSFVHSHSIYDWLLWLIGFPLAFWICFKFSTVIEKATQGISPFVKNALYFYAFIGTLFLIRVVFHYVRWVSPLVEYRAKNNSIIAHRTFLAALIIGILGTFVADLIKFVMQ